MARHSERCKECKRSVYRLLRASCGEVKEQYDLNLPTQLGEYSSYQAYFGHLQLIYERLQNYRGYSTFVRSGKLSPVDYYLPSLRLVVEFDESQHFTEPRGISLNYYPPDLKLGYNRQTWIALARKLHRKDNDPPYRDEQRAWYDTLRDFSSLILENQPTIRLYAGDRQWCLLDERKSEDVTLFANMVLGR